MSASLIAILVVFVILMAVALFVSLRSRRRATAVRDAAPVTGDGDEENDNRIAVMFFAAILIGAALAVAAAVVIFTVP